MTLDEQRRVLESANVAIKDGLITEITDNSNEHMPADRVIDVSGKVVLPGFVNVHSHNLHILMRGGASDLSLFVDVLDWTLNALDPSMRAHDRSDAYLAARLYAIEAIRSGVTTTVENLDYSFIDMMFEESVAAYDEMGIRVILGDVYCDVLPDHIVQAWEILARRHPDVQHRMPAFPLQDTTAALDRIESRMKAINDRPGRRITVCPAPISPVLNSPDGLARSRELADRFDTPLLIHAAVDERFDQVPGMTNVQYLESIGILGPRLLATHMVDVDSNDIRTLKKHRVGIGYCPASMMAMGGGVAPVLDYLNAGLAVGIGTDDPNANQSVNLISEMKLASLAQNQRYGSNALSAERALELATIDGARAIGIDQLIGSLEVGKRADIIVCNLDGPHNRPLHNVASVMVYQANGSEVETVLVDGEVLMEDRRLRGFDNAQEAEFLQRVQNASSELLERAGMTGFRDRSWESG